MLTTKHTRVLEQTNTGYVADVPEAAVADESTLHATVCNPY